MIRGRGSAAAMCAAGALLAGCDADPAPGGDPPSPTAAAPTGSASAASSSPPRASTGPPGPATRTSTPPTLPPPYVAGAQWVQTDVGASLQIRPTRNGRDVSGTGVADEAWREVIAAHPDAATPGMRAQFDCHWTFARIADPEKPSWNLEPSRPVVTESEMISARCNPGAAEEGPAG